MGKSKRKAAAEEPAADDTPRHKKLALASSLAAQPEGTEFPTHAQAALQGAAKKMKEKPLVLCARGITYRYRHLMTDLMQLLPHHKTDSKLDTKHDWNAINEVAELKGATSVLFFEARKRTDLYLWLAKVPSGPSVRFLCTNVHTMAELKLSGNHLKGSRPVLAFDAAFDEQPQLQIMKELLQQVFVTPKGHQKSKPFFDHVISFTLCDNRIWLRNYQVLVALDKKKVAEASTTLVEVGPRLTLQPIKVFAGSFRGKVLFENPEFINPNAVRAYEKRKAAGTYNHRVSRKAQRQAHEAANTLDEPALSNRQVFAEDGDASHPRQHAGSRAHMTEAALRAAQTSAQVGSGAEIDGLSADEEDFDEGLLHSSAEGESEEDAGAGSDDSDGMH